MVVLDIDGWASEAHVAALSLRPCPLAVASPPAAQYICPIYVSHTSQLVYMSQIRPIYVRISIYVMVVLDVDEWASEAHVAALSGF